MLRDAAPVCPHRSPVGGFLCDPASPLDHWSSMLRSLWQVWWPVLVVVVAVLVLAGIAATLVRRAAWRRAAASARWLEIRPPARSPTEAAWNFWQAIAGILNRTRRHTLAPKILAMEFVATAETTRVGIWVPTALSVRAVTGAVTSAWPGAQTTVTDPPVLTDAPRLDAVEVTPRDGQWTPLFGTDRRRSDAHTDEPLAHLLTVLAARRHGETGCVQVIVTAHRRVPAPLAGGLVPRAMVALLAAPFRVLLGVVDLFWSPRGAVCGNRSSGGREAEDPVVTARQRAVEAKKARGPHLRITIRVSLISQHAAASTRGRPRRNTVAAIAGGFDRVAHATDLTLTRSHRAKGHASTRRPGRGFIATVNELAMLWHLPAHAAYYNIAQTPARSRDPGRDLPRLSRHASNGADDVA